LTTIACSSAREIRDSIGNGGLRVRAFSRFARRRKSRNGKKAMEETQ
jgi:hypothetical protein